MTLREELRAEIVEIGDEIAVDVAALEDARASVVCISNHLRELRAARKEAKLALQNEAAKPAENVLFETPIGGAELPMRQENV